MVVDPIFKKKKKKNHNWEKGHLNSIGNGAKNLEPENTQKESLITWVQECHFDKIIEDMLCS